MKRTLRPGDRVQFTRYWLLHHSMKGAPRVPHTQDDVGVIINVVKSLWPKRDGKYARVQWIAGPERPITIVRLDALEPHGVPRDMTRYPIPKSTPTREEPSGSDKKE